MRRLKILFVAVSGLFLTVSCQQEEIECLRVSGEIETQKRTLDDFNKVFFNDVGNLHISQGNEVEVLFKGQKNVLDNLVVGVNNEELIINLAQCFNGDDYQFDVFITIPEWKQIKMAGVGNVKTTHTINAEDITVILSGISDKFKLDIHADSISTIMSGKGTIEFSGSANKHRMLLSGVGSIKAFDLPVKFADVSNTGNGDVFVFATESLKATLSSSGNVFYRGGAVVTKNENGAGKVINDN